MCSVTRNETVLLTIISFAFSSQIKWSNRFDRDKGRACKTYYDGIDCRVLKWRNANGEYKNWSSHKFNKKPAVRYGVSTCIQTGMIVAVHGPFPAGAWADQTIYLECVVPNLRPGEKVEVDQGFHGHTACRPQNFLCKSEKEAKKAAAGRHETVNGRFKFFRSLDKKFRNNVHEHKYFFFTAVVVTQMMFEQYGTTFDVSY